MNRSMLNLMQVHEHEGEEDSASDKLEGIMEVNATIAHQGLTEERKHEPLSKAVQSLSIKVKDNSQNKSGAPSQSKF